MMKAAAINNMRFYIDTSSGEFLMPNVVADSNAAAYVTSYRVTADKAGISAISMSGVGKGPIALFSVTSGEIIATSTS